MQSDQTPDHVPPTLVYHAEQHESYANDADPFVGMQALRELPEIFYNLDTRLGTARGSWVITRSELFKEILKDADAFSSHGIAGFSALVGEEWPLIPLEIDPPLQTEFRKAMAPLLSPARVRDLEPDIRELAVHLVGRIENERQCDFVKAFGTPLPVVIFMRLMGMPLERLDTFLHWEHDLLHSGEIEKRMAAGRSIQAFLLELIDESRANPDTSGDLVSFAVQMEIDGEKLSTDQIMGMCFLFFAAGLDTVAGTLGYIFRYLATHPADRRRLAEDASMIPDAIEELMRRHSIVATRRMVTRDMEFHGVRMKAGDYVECDLGLAGTDPEAFADPLTVDITRRPNPHLAFGGGPHRCFGSNLARAEMRIGLEEWLVRIPDFEIAPDAALRSHAGVKGLDSLPIVW